MFDYYLCDNPECEGKFTAYERFCPLCGSEKSIHLVANGMIKDVLMNLVHETSKEKLDKVCKNDRYIYRPFYFVQISKWRILNEHSPTT